jgi:putative tryptophan/tyrosine transport system substrate-binding protein
MRRADAFSKVRTGMTRLTLALSVGIALALLVWPVEGQAQEAPKIARIGYLATDLTAGDPRNREAFRQGLRDLGYLEGRNLVIEYRDARGKPERFPALAAELVAMKVDVIVSTGGTAGTLAARQATTTLPIVFTAVGDPVADGLVKSLAQPGGNVTGLSVVSTELVAKWLELLKEAVSRISLVAFLVKPDSIPDQTKRDILRAADVAAGALRVRLQVVEARGPEDFKRAFSDMTGAHADALALLATPLFTTERRRLVDLATRHRLPTVSSFRDFPDAGGLMSYGPSLADLARRAAIYVDKILKGAKPSELPVEQPTKFDLVINLKTAKTLRLKIPPSLLARADEVIEK